LSAYLRARYCFGFILLCVGNRFPFGAKKYPERTFFQFLDGMQQPPEFLIV